MSIRVERIPDKRPPNSATEVTLKQMGENIYEVRYSKTDTGGNIKKIDGDFYEVTVGTDDSGNAITEVREFEKTAESRADNPITVRQSMRNLRDLINTNVSDNPERCLWVTLTYAENMRDTERLYTDMEKFTKRLRYYLKNKNLPEMEYIYAIEPQARGAWHAHCLFCFNTDKAPFIPNDKMSELWGHGFTKTKSLKGISNPGLYLTAYLTDLDFTQAMHSGNSIKGDGIKEVIYTGEDGAPVSKAIVKGGRLHLYPAGMRFFRVSRGIRRPEITKCTEREAMSIVGDAPLTFERTIAIGDDEIGLINTINYRTYNRKGKPKNYTKTSTSSLN